MTSRPSLKSTSIERRIKSLTPFALKKFIAILIVNPLVGKLIKISRVKFNMLGGVFDYSLVEDTAAAAIFFGGWEGAEIRLAKRFAENETIVELGSSVGVTLGTLAKTYPKARFVCVEASPRNFLLLQKLRRHLSENSSIQLYNKAIDYSGATHVNFAETSYTGSKIADIENKNEETVSVETITFANLLKTAQIEGNYTLITDIEGAEADVFFKDSLALERCTKIICELENTEKYSMQDQVNHLVTLGFEVIEYYGNVYHFARN